MNICFFQSRKDSTEGKREKISADWNKHIRHHLYGGRSRTPHFFYLKNLLFQQYSVFTFCSWRSSLAWRWSSVSASSLSRVLSYKQRRQKMSLSYREKNGLFIGISCYCSVWKDADHLDGVVVHPLERLVGMESPEHHLRGRKQQIFRVFYNKMGRV